ncbi:MAG: hypothetical protein AUG09_05000 [Acidobacteria bacterium 13_1_20CM_2_68_7]|nr:MAG: hypothetical protein AUG09_05000 [Acidobacteria bacterium 13_1_20CM_2_68_7]
MGRVGSALQPVDVAPNGPAGRPPTGGRGERRVLLALSGALILLRVAYAFVYPVDTDEPQHLHIAWAWTKGLLPYRDVFDNHAPLFHVLSAPLIAVIGEDPRVLLFMRLAMLPVFAAALAGSYALGRRLFGARAGAWAAILCGLSPTFFFKSVEYRTDVLWAALWVLAVATLLGRSLGRGRAFRGGLLAGVCLAVSLKTIMLLCALGIAAVSISLLAGSGTARSDCATGPKSADAGVRRLRDSWSLVLAFLAGLLVAPAAVVLYFSARGALADLYYCTIQHNLLPGVGRWGYSRRVYLLPPILALLIAAARFLIRHLTGGGARVAFLLLLSGTQYLLLSTVWPVHTRQDLLPFYPLFTVLLAGLLLDGPVRAAAEDGRSRWSGVSRLAVRFPVFLACVELAVLPAVSSLTGRGIRPQMRQLAEVLRLTKPADYVLDRKGESVFRNRPFYYALETMTLERMARGLIPDSIPERCVETRTCVAPADTRGFPPRARRFLEDNYIVVGTWRVAGRLLTTEAGAVQGRALPFQVIVPARYAIVAEIDAARGRLDGLPYDGPRDLPPGRHDFLPASGGGRLAVIWAGAAERGFSPFAPAGGAP